MEKPTINLIELGINLIFAVAVVTIIMNIFGMARDAVVTQEQQREIENYMDIKAEFGDLNNSTVEYARAIELVTKYAGELDVYVDSTCDNGAILICTQAFSVGSAVWSGRNCSYPLDASKRIGSLGTTDYPSITAMKTTEAQMLLSSDLSEKFANGKWKVYLAANGENVVTCIGSAPSDINEITGIRFKRIQ